MKTTNSLYDNPIQQKKILPPLPELLNKPKQPEPIIKPTEEESIKESSVEENSIVEDSILKEINEEKSDILKTITKKLEYKPNFKIDKIPLYPTVSKKLGQEGTISLLISLDNKGEILSVDVNKSTGYKLLDDSAIKTAKEWNYKQLVDGYTNNYLVTTNIVFRLE